jgi:hypothetical protein
MVLMLEMSGQSREYLKTCIERVTGLNNSEKNDCAC